MVAWIRENTPAKLEGLWESVLPEGSTAPPAEFAADLFWLLHQGHILLYTDDTLVVQEARDASAVEPGTAAKKAKKKKKAKKPKPTIEAKDGESPSPEETPAADATKTEAEPTESPAPSVVVGESAEAPSPTPVEESPAISETAETPAPESEPEETHPFAD
jgi:outer membrane biosynthesis protein TonB